MLVLVVSHEMGHACFARWCGLRVFGIRLGFLHGMCIYESPDTRLQHVAVAWGGIVAQSVLFAIAVVVSQALRAAHVDLAPALSEVLFTFTAFNALLMLLNLLPIRPLDGATAWQVFPEAFAYLRATATARSVLRRTATRHLSIVRDDRRE